MRDLLGRLNISGFDAESYITKYANNASALPNIAIAVSGGGYRACLNGGGAVQAFDSREVNSTTAGHLGGLLQSATYLAGLSGGGWLVGSIYVNNFTTITDLLDNDASSVWEFGNSIFEGPDTGSIQVLDSAAYYTDIEHEVSAKADAGFNTSVTDFWGRGTCLSSLPLLASFQSLEIRLGSSNFEDEPQDWKGPSWIEVTDLETNNSLIFSTCECE